MREVSPDTQTDLDASRICWFAFFKIEFPAPTGVLRFTDYPQVVSYDIDLDGATETYQASNWPFTLGMFEQSTSGAMGDLSSLTLVNINRAWNEFRKLHGLTSKPITIWLVRFNVDTLAVENKVLLYEGLTETAACGQKVTLTLLPGTPAYAKLFPAQRIDGTLFKYLPPPDMEYEYDDVRFDNLGQQAILNQTPTTGGPTFVQPPGGGGIVDRTLHPDRGRSPVQVVDFRGRGEGRSAGDGTEGSPPTRGGPRQHGGY